MASTSPPATLTRCMSRMMHRESALLAAFLAGEIDNANFRHADHVRVGFELLSSHDFATAAHRFSMALREIARRAGNPAAYHDTITIAFLALIAERSAIGEFAGVEDFLQRNPDLLDKSVLERWYAPERLRSAVARRVFILPEVTR
jgi:hypothetical protein